MRQLLLMAAVMLMLWMGTSGCGAHGHTSVTMGATKTISPGVLFHEVDLPGGDGTRTLWIYLPAHPAAAKIPCVFIAPAGTPCIFGNSLGEGDQPEHLPYVKAGMAVVAYSLDGNVDDPHNGHQIIQGIRAFRNANGGLDNEKAAVNYALAHLPQIDSSRLYAAGHSSAATMSLLAAESDGRFAACIAYAPVGDVTARVGSRYIDRLDRYEEGFATYVAGHSPINNTGNLSCPVFLFHADDDSNVPTSEDDHLAEALQKTNPSVTYRKVASGDHYDSMIEQGIPQAISWLKSLPRE